MIIEDPYQNRQPRTKESDGYIAPMGTQLPAPEEIQQRKAETIGAENPIPKQPSGRPKAHRKQPMKIGKEKRSAKADRKNQTGIIDPGAARKQKRQCKGQAQPDDRYGVEPAAAHQRNKGWICAKKAGCTGKQPGQKRKRKKTPARIAENTGDTA